MSSQLEALNIYISKYSLKLGGKGVAVEDRARHVIQYAIEARTALIKLLALLKWKNQADVEQILPNGDKQGRVSLAPVSRPVSSMSMSAPSAYLIASIQGLDQWQDQQNAHNREVRNQLEVWAEDLKRFQCVAIPFPDRERTGCRSEHAFILSLYRLQTPDIATAVDLLVEGMFKRGPQYLDVRSGPSEC